MYKEQFNDFVRDLWNANHSYEIATILKKFESALQSQLSETTEDLQLRKDVLKQVRKELGCKDFEDIIQHSISIKKQLSEAREAPTYSDSDCVDIAFDFGYGCDIPKGDKNQESVHGAAVWGLMKMRDLLSTQKPEEGKEPDNTLNCNCTSDRQTPLINGKHICSICNKPLY